MAADLKRQQRRMKILDLKFGVPGLRIVQVTERSVLTNQMKNKPNSSHDRINNPNADEVLLSESIFGDLN